jgi:hypothetical protein
VEALRLAIDALIGGVRADQSPAIREALMVDCTCRVIEKCERCEAIDAAEDAPCKCGDYRSEHQDGTGRCLTCAAHAHMQPFVPCEQFRPSAENAPTHTQRVIAEVDAAVEQAFATEDSSPETWCDTCTSWRGNPYCGRVDCPAPAPFDWGDWRPCAHHPTADHEIVCFACNPILFGGMKGRQLASPGRTEETPYVDEKGRRYEQYTGPSPGRTTEEEKALAIPQLVEIDKLTLSIYPDATFRELELGRKLAALRLGRSSATASRRRLTASRGPRPMWRSPTSP